MMASSELKLLEWLLLALGVTLVLSGWRTIKKRRTRTYLGEHEGNSAAHLGWLWLVIGLLLLLAALFDITVLKSFGRLFLESAS